MSDAETKSQIIVIAKKVRQYLAAIRGVHGWAVQIFWRQRCLESINERP